jgi:cyclopropane fatty-acyl-phospholipid synthase-like methyltransferase
MIKPFSQACANNGPPILMQLTRLLASSKTVLEIGSGTGQHAIYFAAALPHLVWQPSDLAENHEGIQCWINESGTSNVLPPYALDVRQAAHHTKIYDAVFMANTLHIMNWFTVEHCFTIIAQHLDANGLLIVYGPFNYDGKFTSESNERFDQWLKAADEERGIRDIERVNKLAGDLGLFLEEDIAMPANNRLLVWRFKG